MHSYTETPIFVDFFAHRTHILTPRNTLLLTLIWCPESAQTPLDVISAIRALKHDHHRADYWDLKTPAFGIRVGRAAPKCSSLRSVNSRVAIGRVPWPFPCGRPAQGARREDPKTPRIVVSKVTFEHAYEKFKEVHCSRKKARTAARLYAHSRKAFPFGTSYHAAQQDHINPPRRDHRQAPSTPSEHAHALAVARTFFRWCVRPPHRYIDHSPLEGLQLDHREEPQAGSHRCGVD